MNSADVLARDTSEDQLLATVTDALTRLRWLWTHSRRSDRAQLMGGPGLPDLIAVRGPRLLFVELKAEAGRLSERQKEWQAALQTVAWHHAGMPEVWLVKPSSMDVFLAALA